MDIYIAICQDVHIDDDIKVFTSQERAIRYAIEFAERRSKWNGYEEEELTSSMIRDGWLYYATYSGENSVRVEKSVLDPEVQ